MKSYVIHLIRHGAIDETLSGKYIGTTDPPLSDKGKLALKKLAFTHAYPQPPVVFLLPTPIRSRRWCSPVRSSAAPKPARCCFRSGSRW